ncbi:MAG TPA: hypothetical protein VGM17_08440 [Rhizomicrobium sp.]|jgi:hypothetical protein
MAKAEGKKKRGGEGREKGEKKGNPLVAEVRTQYAKTLTDQGLPKEQVKEKVKAHIKEVVKPALSAAKTTAAERNLKGPAKRKFIQDEVRSKLGQPAQG